MASGDQQRKAACVGNACVDVFLGGVSEWPGRGQRAVVEETATALGGNAMNTAVLLARLGLESHLVATISEDLNGMRILGRLEEHGVHFDGSLCKFASEEESATAQAFVSVADDGEPSFIYMPGVSSKLDAPFLEQWLQRHGEDLSVLHLSSLGILPDLGGDDLGDVIAELKQRHPGLRMSVNVTLVPERTSADWWSVIVGIFPHTDYLILNLLEAGQILGESIDPGYSDDDVFAIAGRLQALGENRPTIIVTLGQNGCAVLVSDGEKEIVPSQPVQMVNATGAGDAWCAGFIYGLTESNFGSVFDAAREGNRIAGKCVLTMGAQEFDLDN